VLWSSPATETMAGPTTFGVGDQLLPSFCRQSCRLAAGPNLTVIWPLNLTTPSRARPNGKANSGPAKDRLSPAKRSCEAVGGGDGGLFATSWPRAGREHARASSCRVAPFVSIVKRSHKLLDCPLDGVGCRSSARAKNQNSRWVVSQRVCVCVCVCVRERERERLNLVSPRGGLVTH
jgi:hypothetical protein